MRISRILSFTALLLTLAFGGAIIAAAHHTTWDGPSVDGPFVLDSIYEVTLFKGDDGSGPGGNVECGQDGAYVKKLDAEDIYVGAEIALSGMGEVIITAFDGKTLDWKIAEGSLDDVDAYQVIVKGGPAATIYTYPVAAADEGFGLTAPMNPKNGKYYGISNVTFCFDDKA